MQRLAAITFPRISRLPEPCPLNPYTFQSENFLLRLKKYPLSSREGIKGRGMIFRFTSP